MKEKLFISFVLPCLNEEAALLFCIEGLRKLATEQLWRAEIIVVDNGSTDQSREIIRSLVSSAGDISVCLVEEAIRGYGSAYRAGLAVAEGKYICMSDADGTYDFAAFPRFIQELEKGADFVIGNRFAYTTARNAMPWAHYYMGNPLLSMLVRVLFKTPVHDVHCGQRALRRDAISHMQLSSRGMEFASEMVVRASECNLKVVQIPIVYSQRMGESKLHPIRDGLRHIQYAVKHVFSR